MRILAIILSPFAGVLLVALVSNFIELWEFMQFETYHIYIIAYCFATIIQVIYVELIFLSAKKNLKNYLIISYITCMIIGVLTYCVSLDSTDFKFEKVIGIFLFFFIYSIGNALTYNILYLKNKAKTADSVL